MSIPESGESMGITGLLIFCALLGYLYRKSSDSSTMRNLPSEETEKEGEQSSQTAASQCPPIPDEIVFEILSWLPVKDVIRFKRVCKLWCSIPTEPAFIKTHMSRARSSLLQPYHIVCGVPRGSYLIQCAGTPNGLVCFLNHDKSFTICNLAISKSLRLRPVHHPTLRPSFCYIPHTGKYKIASFYYSPKREKYFCEMITVGETETPIPSREIQVPFSLHRQFAVKAGTVIYFIQNLRYCFEITTFDLETEVFRSKSFPRSRFNVGSKKNHHKFKFVWDGRLCLGSIVKNKLTAFVLEDYERDEWRKYEVVLPISTEENEAPILPLLFEENKLQLRIGLNKLVVYDLRKQRVIVTFVSFAFSEVSWSYKQTLVTCRENCEKNSLPVDVASSLSVSPDGEFAMVDKFELFPSVIPVDSLLSFPSKAMIDGSSALLLWKLYCCSFSPLKPSRTSAAVDELSPAPPSFSTIYRQNLIRRFQRNFSVASFGQVLKSAQARSCFSDLSCSHEVFGLVFEDWRSISPHRSFNGVFHDPHWFLYEKVTVLESEKRAWENSPEGQAMREALNPWRKLDEEERKQS